MNIAVCHWWGVTPQTVTKWRKALGVRMVTDGTFALRSERASEADFEAIRASAHAKHRDPARNAKIAAERKGKPRPRHVVEAMRKGRKGKPQSEETRLRISAALKGRRLIWTEADDTTVHACSAKEAARLLA